MWRRVLFSRFFDVRRDVRVMHTNTSLGIKRSNTDMRIAFSELAVTYCHRTIHNITITHNNNKSHRAAASVPQEGLI